MTEVKTGKKLLCLLLSLVCVFSCFASTSTVMAQDDTDPEITPYFTTIGVLSYNFDISGVTAKCTASMSAKTSTNLKIVIELQKLSSGSYSTVGSWTATRTGTSLGLEKSKVINVFSDYRMRVTFTAGSEVQTRIVYPD